MNYTAKAPTDLEKDHVFIELTKEQKKLIRITLKKLFRYCTENRTKDEVSWKEMALYNYVRGFWLFNGGYTLREDTYHRYLWISDLPWTFDKKVLEYRAELEDIMGTETYHLFYKKLNEEIKNRFN